MTEQAHAPSAPAASSTHRSGRSTDGGNERLLGVGVDGAPGGWLAAACFGSGSGQDPTGSRTELHFFSDIRKLVAWRAGRARRDKAPVAVDMPIGLPKVVSYRGCDVAARARLPASQKPSVFQAPSRLLLTGATALDSGKPPKAEVIFERALVLVAAEQARLDAEAAVSGEATVSLRKLTQQAAGILAKVEEVDALMREPPGHEQPARESWLVEVHPEMCFRAMADGLVPPAKTSAHGQLQRLDLVRRAFPDAEQRIRAWEHGAKHSLLDVLDAYAACWSAMRWATTDGGAVTQRGDVSPPLEVLGETAPGEPEREHASGLAMRMVV